MQEDCGVSGAKRQARQVGHLASGCETTQGSRSLRANPAQCTTYPHRFCQDGNKDAIEPDKSPSKQSTKLYLKSVALLLHYIISRLKSPAKSLFPEAIPLSTDHFCQPKCIIDLSIRQQAWIAGDFHSVKFEPQFSIKVDFKSCKELWKNARQNPRPCTHKYLPFLIRVVVCGQWPAMKDPLALAGI